MLNNYKLDTHLGAYLFTQNHFRPNGLIGFVALDILHAYADASGKYETTTDRILTVNGCLSTPERWAAFDIEWCEYLKTHKFKRDPRSRRYVFHTSPFWAGACKLMPDRLARSDKYRIYHDLITIIRRHTVYRFGYGILLDDFRRVEAEFPNIRETLLKEPGTRMSLLCFQGNSAWAGRNDYDRAISYTFDRGDRFFKELYKGYAKAMETLNPQEDQIEVVNSLTEADKAAFSPLQAADVLAWECRRNALHWQFAKKILPVKRERFIEPGIEWQPSRELLRLNKPGKSELRFLDESHLKDEMREMVSSILTDGKGEAVIGDGKPFKDLDDFIRGLCFVNQEQRSEEKEARKALAAANRAKKMK